DGKLLATVSADDWSLPGEVMLWDAVSGKALAKMTGHRDGILVVALAPDGGTLASAGRDGAIHLWDIADVRAPRLRLVLRGHEREVTGLVFTPDGRTLVSAGGDRTLRFWQPTLGQPLGTLTLDAAVRSLAFGAAGAGLFWGDEAGQIVQVCPLRPDTSEVAVE